MNEVRPEEQPAWKFALKVGGTIAGLLVAGITIGLMWRPLSDLPGAAQTAKNERRDLQADVRAIRFTVCELRAYQLWQSCVTIYEEPRVSCDREYRTSLVSCEQRAAEAAP